MPDVDLQVALTVTLTPQDVSDLLVTALEGGSNYWVAHVKTADTRPRNTPLAEHVAAQLQAGQPVLLVVEDMPEAAYPLTLPQLHQAFVTASRNWLLQGRTDFLEEQADGSHVLNCGMLDALDADVILQHAAFNEVVFG